MTVDTVFFTRVHFDIFGMFFPRDVPDLRSATNLLMEVYAAENLTLCVTGTQRSSSLLLSSFASLLSSLLLSGHSTGLTGAVRCSPQTNRQQSEVYQQQLTTLRR